MKKSQQISVESSRPAALTSLRTALQKLSLSSCSTAWCHVELPWCFYNQSTIFSMSQVIAEETSPIRAPALQ